MSIYIFSREKKAKTREYQYTINTASCIIDKHEDSYEELRHNIYKLLQKICRLFQNYFYMLWGGFLAPEEKNLFNICPKIFRFCYM